jgi:hypothetical protein
MGDLPVCGYPAAVSLVTHYSYFAVETAKVFEECSQMVSHGRSGKDINILARIMLRDRAASVLFPVVTEHG